MAIIFTEYTDQRPVKCGYCSKCGTYNEVWRKDKVSICNKCDTKMYHISQGWIVVIILVVGLLVLANWL